MSCVDLLFKSKRNARPWLKPRNKLNVERLEFIEEMPIAFANHGVIVIEFAIDGIDHKWYYKE